MDLPPLFKVSLLVECNLPDPNAVLVFFSVVSQSVMLCNRVKVSNFQHTSVDPDNAFHPPLGTSAAGTLSKKSNVSSRNLRQKIL